MGNRSKIKGTVSLDIRVVYFKTPQNWKSSKLVPIAVEFFPVYTSYVNMFYISKLLLFPQTYFIALNSTQKINKACNKTNQNISNKTALIWPPYWF